MTKFQTPQDKTGIPVEIFTSAPKGFEFTTAYTELPF